MDIVNVAHLHLVLNHFPIIGVILVLPWLAFALLLKNISILRASLITLVAISLITIPVYLSGEGAEDIVEKLPGVSETYIESHEEMAVFALSLTLATGFIAFITLVLSIKGSEKNRTFGFITLVLSLITAGVLVLTANYGGKIRHTEIRDNGQAIKIYEDDD